MVGGCAMPAVQVRAILNMGQDQKILPADATYESVRNVIRLCYHDIDRVGGDSVS